MAKMTIAQMREREVNRLAEITNDWDKANNLMNRFYRLCGMDVRLCELENDEYWHDKPHTKNLSDRREKAFNRLRDDFRQYGLDLRYGGICATICENEPGSCIGREVISRYFYQ